MKGAVNAYATALEYNPVCLIEIKYIQIYHFDIFRIYMVFVMISEIC